MTGHSSREELVASLEAYTSLLTARNEALARISRTSAEIKSTLSTSATPDISDAIRRRDEDIAHYASLCADGAPAESTMQAALAAAGMGNNELAELARCVIGLEEYSRSLAREVLACQSECEALLRARVEATAKALQQSAHRRKLDAAYGPALDREAATFVDKQQ